MVIGRLLERPGRGVTEPQQDRFAILKSPAVRYWAPIGGAVIAAVVARLAVSGYSLFLLDTVALAAMGSMALNLLTGVAGQVSLGNAGLIGTGAFTAVVLSQHSVPFPLVLLIAIVFSGLIGVLVGLPALRVRGMYLILSTLALHYIFNYVAADYQSHTSGAGGFTLPYANLFGWNLGTNASDWYLLLAACVIIIWMLLRNLMLAKSGRAWLTIRSSESVAAGLGLPVGRYKLTAFAVSSAILGFQGALDAYFIGSVTADQWTLALATSYVAMITLGGLGSLTGSVVGAALVTLLPTWIGNFLSTAHGLPSIVTSNTGPVTSLVYGLLVVVMLLVAPTGIVGVMRRAQTRLVKVMTR